MSNATPALFNRIEIQVVGEIQLTSGELDVSGRTLFIEGPGSSELTINAMGNSRVLDSSLTHNLSISGVTITGGRTTANSEPGGAIRAYTEFLSLYDSVITGNSTEGADSGGGAIAWFGNEDLDSSDLGPGSVDIRYSQVANNSTSGDRSPGGGVMSPGDRTILRFSEFYGNITSADESPGGGLAISNRLTTVGTSLTFNETRGANSPGGGIALLDSAQGTMTNDDLALVGNRTEGDNSPGAGLYLSAGWSADLEGSFIARNFTSGISSPGGGIAAVGDATLDIDDTLFLKNRSFGSSSPGAAVALVKDTLAPTATINDVGFQGQFTAGLASGGGAIFVDDDAQLSLVDAVLSSNRTENSNSDGGAILIGENAVVTIEDAEFFSNRTNGSNSTGGAISIAGGNVTVSEAGLYSNLTTGASSNGAGIAVESGLLTLTESSLAQNGAHADSSRGGGLFVGGDAMVSRSTLSNNFAYLGGGGAALVANSGTVEFVNSTISGNRTLGNGGGLFVNGYGYHLVEIKNSTITSNISEGDAAGVAGVAVARGAVGAIAKVRVADTIVSANGADDFSAVGFGASDIVSDGFNLIGLSNVAADFNNNDQLGVTDPMLGPLEWNGGLTLTHLPLPGSPALDMGNPNPVASLMWDQRNEPFVRSASDLPGVRQDVGAAELQALPGDFNGDGDYTCQDIDALIRTIASGFDAAFDLNRDFEVDLLDRDIWLELAASANFNSPGLAYLVGDANFDLAVDGLDYIIWNMNKFMDTPVVPGWCEGNFNGDGVVDGLDFIEWNTNKFQSAGDRLLPNAVAAVSPVAFEGRSGNQQTVMPLNSSISDPVVGGNDNLVSNQNVGHEPNSNGRFVRRVNRTERLDHLFASLLPWGNDFYR